MQTYNCLLALAGDRDNVIPKYGVTAGEIAVLREIHGEEAVSDVDVAGEVKRSSREERSRLFDKYSRMVAGGPRRSPELDALFPGIAARLPDTLDEIDFPEDFYKATERAVPNRKPAKREEAPKADDEPVSVDDMTKAQLVEYAKANDIEIDASAKKDEVLAAIKAAETNEGEEPDADENDADENDGIGEIDDNLFK